MVQLSISQAQVNAAADELRAAGITPTRRNVREKLGDKGSADTILRMLKVWQEAQAMPAISLGDPLPKEVLDGLQVAFNNAKSEIAAKYERELLTARADRSQAMADLTAHHTEYAEMKSRCDFVIAENLKLSASNNELKVQVESLKDSDKQRQAAEKRAAAAEASLALLEPLPRQLKQMEAEAKEAAAAHTKELSDLRAAHKAEIEKLQAAVKAAQDKAAAELAKAAQALSKANAESAEVSRSLEAARARIDALTAQLATETNAKTSAEEKASKLSLELSKAQGSIEVLHKRAELVDKLQAQVMKLEAQVAVATEAETTAPKKR